MTNWKICLAVGVLLVKAYTAEAQYFARNSVQLPSIGWVSMDSSFAVNQVKWGLNDQIQIGTGYARDIWDLKLWWTNETAVGFAGVNIPGELSSRIAVTLQGSTGLKYNFQTERKRPFVGLMIEVFQIFNTQDQSLYPYVMSSLTWAAIRPHVGFEWVFSSDMSVEMQVGYVGMLNFADPMRHSVMARFAYRLYF